MKANVKVEKRIIVKENRKLGIRNFDDDNAYPQRMKDLVASSGQATSCVGLLAAFIEGDGLTDEIFAKSVINKKGLTTDELNSRIADDLSYNRGFALIVNYNLALQISEVYHQPFAHCRLGDDEHLGKIAVYDNWAKEKSSKIKDTQIRWFHVFDPRPEVVRQQIVAAGGIEAYKGQVLWFSLDGQSTYPASSIDSVQEDVHIDSLDKTFRHSTVRKSFAPSVALVTSGSYGNDGNADGREDADAEAQRTEFANMIKAHQGPDNVNSILHIDLDSTDDIDKVLKFVPLPNVDNSKMYDGIRKSTKDAIIEAFGQPKMLLGIETAGKLGTATEIKDAQDFYNAKTVKLRRLVERAYNMVFSLFAEPISPTGDYSIIPITIVKPGDAVAFAQNQLRITIGYWQGVNMVAKDVKAGIYDYDAAVAWMKMSGGFTEVEARAMLGPKPESPPIPPIPPIPPPTT
jgi:hypothetical protein